MVPSQELIFDRTCKVVRDVMPRRVAARWKDGMSRELHCQADLGLDSLSMANVAFQLEREFGFNLLEAPPDLAAIRTLGDIADYVERLLRRGRE